MTWHKAPADATRSRAIRDCLSTAAYAAACCGVAVATGTAHGAEFTAAGAFAQMAARVPEPHAATLAVGAAIWRLAAARRPEVGGRSSH